MLSLAANGLLGILMYRLVLIRVRGMSISEIISSYAIGLAILEGLRYGGFRGMTYTLPVFMDGMVIIGGVPVDYHRIVMVVVGILLVAVLWVFTHFTKLGLALQAWPRMNGPPSCWASTPISWPCWLWGSAPSWPVWQPSPFCRWAISWWNPDTMC